MNYDIIKTAMATAKKRDVVSPIARLTMAQARKIRSLHRRGWTQMELSWAYEISQTTISKIVNNQIYRGAA